jgi:hypothetical protein
LEETIPAGAGAVKNSKNVMATLSMPKRRVREKNMRRPGTQ